MTEPSATTFIGMDVSKNTIAIALLRPGEHVPLEQTIANTPEAGAYRRLTLCQAQRGRTSAAVRVRPLLGARAASA